MRTNDFLVLVYEFFSLVFQLTEETHGSTVVGSPVVTSSKVTHRFQIIYGSNKAHSIFICSRGRPPARRSVHTSSTLIQKKLKKQRAKCELNIIPICECECTTFASPSTYLYYGGHALACAYRLRRYSANVVRTNKPKRQPLIDKTLRVRFASSCLWPLFGAQICAIGPNPLRNDRVSKS